MKYRLGIDLGTSSIGTAAYALDDEGNATDLVHLDSYVFGEPILPKTMETKNSARRAARMQRRQIERKGKRFKKIYHIANTIGLNRENIKKVEGDRIHLLRAKAIKEKIELPELIKVFLHIVKNRGYKGNLKRDNSGVGGEIKKLEKEIEEKNCKTLGELWLKRKEEAKDGKRFTGPWKNTSNKMNGSFTKRDFIKDEFDLIWEEQLKHHKELDCKYKVSAKTPYMFPNFKGQTEISLKDAFKSAIFYQRPIKWSLETVGNCPLETTEKRAAKAQIAFQHFRIACVLSNIRIVNRKNRKETRKLADEQYLKLFNVLNTEFNKFNGRDEIPYGKLYDILSINKDVEKFNVDRDITGEKRGLKGNITLKTLSDIGMIDDWGKLTEKSQEIVIEFLSNVTDFADIEENEDEYIKESVKKFSENIRDVNNLSAEQAFSFVKLLKDKEVFSKNLDSKGNPKKRIELENGRAEYSVKALKKLTEEIKKGTEEETAKKELYEKVIEQRENLRPFIDVRTGNPVIDRVLREFKRTLKYIIHKLKAKPSEITIELARDLKKSLAQRDFIEKDREHIKDINEAIKFLKGNGIYPTKKNILRYRLCKEQDNKCPYCGDIINSGQEFDEHKTEIDHIIPQASGGPNIYSNFVLGHSKCNLDKGDNTPFLASKSGNLNFDATKKIAEIINKKAEVIKPRPVGRKWQKPLKKRDLEKKAANLITEKSLEELQKDFSERQFNETAWISKIVLDWCVDICPKGKVVASAGGITSHLRDRVWELKNLLARVRIKEKKPIYNNADTPKKMDVKKWEELFLKKDVKHTDSLFSEEFEGYLTKNPKEQESIKTDFDKQKSFWRFLDVKRSEYSFNKRCDHRHHALDAAVIGLCSRGLIQKAQRHSARHGALKRMMNKQTGKIYSEAFTCDIPFKGDNPLSKQLFSYLYNYTVWHKPDRLPNKSFFDETAYNILERDGKKHFVKRYSLDYLIKDENKKKNATAVDETISNIKVMVVGESIKKAIIDKLEENREEIENNKKPIKDVLLGSGENEGVFYNENRVKKVQCVYKKKTPIHFNEGVDIRIKKDNKKGRTDKCYMSGGYACMDFDKKTGKRIDLIPVWKFHNEYAGKNKKGERITKPIPEGFVRIFAGDTLFNKENKQFYVVESFIGRDGLSCSLTSESLSKNVVFGNIKNLLPVKDRKTLADIKREYKNGK